VLFEKFFSVVLRFVVFPTLRSENPALLSMCSATEYVQRY
jgi:hypothetical protein